jgi:hypothetical protein
MEHWVVCKIHNNREEPYLIPEELVSHIAISLSCLVIFFLYFITIIINYKPNSNFNNHIILDGHKNDL